MFQLMPWQAAVGGLGLIVVAVLMMIWWRQQSYRWIIVAAVCFTLAPLLSWWTGLIFQLPDYRAGCDGLCFGYSGAPVPFITGEAAGSQFLPGMFLVNTLVYLVIQLGWTMLLRTILNGMQLPARGKTVRQLVISAFLIILPLASAPLILPPPEAHMRGDPQRIAINALREVYLYDNNAPLPVLRVGLEDVRPRQDGQLGMRVCLRAYTFFYLPLGSMYLDMTPEGVHSNAGGMLPLEMSCWN